MINTNKTNRHKSTEEFYPQKLKITNYALIYDPLPNRIDYFICLPCDRVEVYIQYVLNCNKED